MRCICGGALITLPLPWCRKSKIVRNSVKHRINQVCELKNKDEYSSTVVQSVPGNQWHSMGFMWFPATRSERRRIGSSDDCNHHAGCSHLITFFPGMKSHVALPLRSGVEYQEPGNTNYERYRAVSICCPVVWLLL